MDPQTIAHYRITAKLGAGGMGEVYRAVDTKLDREVALKILPPAFAQDADRMARFEREAKVLASLNHPNIAQIYGVEERALVMELVEGETLKGPLPLETALNYARQISDALQAAHDKGITHRDLKPANIMVTPAGMVKVLDFGLAALPSRDLNEGAENSANSPTLTMTATQVGTIMGTAAYMSPEQAKGKPVDRRADIWAFGVVLWEMLAGERLFQGEDVGDILASVIKDEPRWDPIPKQAHRLLKACLQKDPKRRLHSIADAMLLVDDAPASSERPSAVVEVPSPRKLPWLVAALLALGLGALAFIHFRGAPPAAPVQRYTIAAPENSNIHSLAISPDGRNVVIAATVNGKRQLWLRPLDALQAQPMPLTEDATFPFWSPDSRYIGFFAQNKLKKIAATGGPSQSLCDVRNARGGSWNRDDVIVFSLGGFSIQRVSAAGGVPAEVFKTKGDLRYPVFVPDGHHFLYETRGMTPEKDGIYFASLDGAENRRILSDLSSPVLAPPTAGGGKLGHILFVRENTFMAQVFDFARAQLADDVLPVADGVELVNGGYAPATVSNSGILLYASGSIAGGGSQIGWYDRAGKLLGPVVPPGPVFHPAISPDEKSVVFSRSSSTAIDLWLRDLIRGTETRFTSDSSLNVTPLWSPKGDRIVFASNRHGGVFNLLQKASSGSGQDEVLLTTGNGTTPTQWSRDGRFIVYVDVDLKTKSDLWVLPMDGLGKGGRPVPFLQTEFNELMAQLSPNSHWMAYTSEQSGRREVYVRPFPRAEGQWTISAAGGEQPRWRGDGKELFYIAADGKMMAVQVKASSGPNPAFVAGSPVALFDTHIAPPPTDNITNYDVTADGKRFLIPTPSVSGSASSPMLNVVVNWNAGLKEMIGKTIAHYRITAKLGAGGMGEVYRAVDTKLDREVALKILPPAFAQDADRMARFEREAKVLASLNHPNIAQIYGVEERALVMELVEGETLKGPLPLDTALNYARQIADALEAAHDKGIVHRDLKPANVKITPDGVVKVLDFGLATAVDDPAPSGDSPNSPTLTMRATQAGMIMGTAAYMSPEQARAHPTDRRADVWAFGVVLYEMLSGKMAFQGDSVTDILASVVKMEPD